VEFAIIASAFFTFCFSALSLIVSVWVEIVMQDASFEAARCDALSSSLCAAIPSGCSGNAIQCYALTIAAERGVPSLSVSGVTVNGNATSCGPTGMTYVEVTMVETFTLLQYSLPLSAQSCFPKP